MQRGLSILFLFFSVSMAGQDNTLKIKKPLRQDNMVTVVTMAGLYYGTCSVDSFLMDTKLKLSNNIDSLKIVEFDVAVLAAGTVYSYQSKSDSLSKEIVTKINSLRKSSNLKVWISPIKALAINGETVLLNPIEIKLKD